MRPLRQILRFVLLMCMAAAGLSAQEERALFVAKAATIQGIDDEATPAFSPTIFTMTRDVSEVQVEFLVVDRSGQPLANLKADDLQVIADGKLLPEIKSFGRVNPVPINLGILVDRSESIRPEMQLHVVTFADAVNNIMEPSQDREFAVAFSNKVTVLQSPTSDFLSVRRALEHAVGDHNLTSLYDAVVRVCRDEFRLSGTNPEKRILLLFSDGVDNLSIHSLQDAIQEAKTARVTVYAVAPQFGDEYGRRALQILTNETGGHLELLHKSAEPEFSLAAIRTLETNQYRLSFRPPNTEPGLHRIELKAVSHDSRVLQAQDQYCVGGASR